VAAGLPIFAAAFKALDPRVQVHLLKKDGQHFGRGERLVLLEGASRGMLAAERTALNFVQQLSGVASLTAAYVAAARGSHSKILDTRKTVPGLRQLQKYAVLCGGGTNHRMDLGAAILLKDNHLRLCGGSPAEAIRRCRRGAPGLAIEIEVENLAELADALSEAPEIVLLDNMPRRRLRQALGMLHKAKPKPLSEISGGVRLAQVRGLARLGVDRISVGALTHSAPSLDLSLEFF
jgi:nicotinate-nucleotide pyrophosphorylase (carboxylating)